MTVTTRPGPAQTGTAEQLSLADRAARGKDARALAPLDSQAEFSPGRTRGSGRAAARPGGVAGAGASPGPSRADAGLPVHLLPGRGAADGRGLGHDSRVRAPGTAVRGRPPVQFRRVRLAGAEADLRRQRLRRDPARTVRVGYQAAGRKPGRGRSGQEFPAKTGRKIALEVGESYRTAMASSLGSPLDVWYSHLDIELGHRRIRSQVKATFKLAEAAGQGPHRDSPKPLGKLTTVVDGQLRSQRPRSSSRARSSSPRCTPTRSSAAPHRAGQVSAQPAVRPSAPARAVPWSRWPARSWASEVSAPGPGSCSWTEGRRRPADPAGQGSRSVGPGGVRRASGYTNQGERVVAGQHLKQAQRTSSSAGPRRRPLRGGPGFLRPPAEGLEVLADREDAPEGTAVVRRDVRAGPGPGPRPLRRPDRARRLPRAARPSSTRPSPNSPRRTPIRTNSTTPRSRPPPSKTARPKPPPGS